MKLWGDELRAILPQDARTVHWETEDNAPKDSGKYNLNFFFFFLLGMFLQGDIEFYVN